MQSNQGPQAQGELATSQEARTVETEDRIVENNNKSTMKTLSKTDQDIVRLIGQHLRGLGLNQTANQLFAESGCKMEDASAANLRTHVMNGSWEKACRSLNDMKDMIPSSTDFSRMQFLLLEQKYLELLEDGHAMDALDCLRFEVSRVHCNTPRLHELATYLMVSSAEEVRKMSHWEGKGPATRQRLLEKLQGFLPPSMMIPPRRLLTLLNQALEQQRQNCLFHNSLQDKDPNSVSFLMDHICGKDHFPSHTIKVLSHNIDEVWFCAFSPDGKKLATGSKDGELFIYSVDLETHGVHFKQKFDDHPKGVSFITWSPDSVYLIACGAEDCPDVWIYNIDEEMLHKRVNRSPDDSLTCAAWLPDGRRFVTGGTRGQFLLCDLDGRVVKTWEGVRVQDLCTMPNSDLVLMVDTQYRVRGYRFEDHLEHNIIQEDHPIMSFSINETGRLALLNVASQGVHLWDLKDRVLVRKFQGMTHGYFTTYSSFGGVNQDFVASGSEDPAVYIYHVKHNRPVLILRGHRSIVNCVHWNPKLPSMLASASDDGTVRIWGPKSRVGTEDGDLGSSTPV